MSKIYDYMMESYKGHAVMGEPMRAATISSALWRLAGAGRSGYCRLRKGVYRVGDPGKTMRETPSLYERVIRIISRAERELAGNFYVDLNQGMDLEAFIETQKADHGVPDRLGRVKAELVAI